MAIKHFYWVPNRRQVHLFIPAKEELYILLNLKDLMLGCRQFKFGKRSLDRLAGGGLGFGCLHFSK